MWLQSFPRRPASRAEVLHAVEDQFNYPDGEGSLFKALFPTPASFSAGVRTEQNRVLARLGWIEVPIVVNNKTHIFFYRDLLQTGVDAGRSVAMVDLVGGMLRDAADGSRCPSSFFVPGLFFKDVATIRKLHGAEAPPLFANQLADEALVSWSGAHYVLPIRAEFPSVNCGGQWVTVRYVPRMVWPTEHGSNVHLVASDERNDLLQRYLAMLLRRHLLASERGYPVDVSKEGPRLLVARIEGVVVDFLEERSIYALGGTWSDLMCSH